MKRKEAEPKRNSSSGATSRWMVAALLLAAVAFSVRFIGPQTVGEQIRRHVETKLREHYAGLDVTIGSGRFEPEIGVILQDISISQRDGATATSPIRSLADRIGYSTSARELLRIDRLVVVASADMEKLLDRQNPLRTRRILITGVNAHAWFDQQDELSLQALWPLPRLGEVTCPRVEVRDAHLFLHRNRDDARPIDIHVSEAVTLKHSVMQPRTGDPTNAQAASNQASCSTTIALRGDCEFSDAFQFRVEAAGDATKVQGQATGVRFSSGLISRLPSVLRQHCGPASGLELLADTSVALKLSDDQPVDFVIRSRIHEGQFRHPEWSGPIKGIRGIITCRPQGAQFEACQAYWGDARITVDGQTTGYGLPVAAELDVTADNLMLDQRLAAIAPGRLRSVWSKFLPNGLIDVSKAHLKIGKDQFECDANVTLKGVDINYDKFPYPIRQMTGEISVARGRVSSQRMSGRVGGRLMQCLFDLPIESDSAAPRVFSAAMDAPVAIDAELLQALSPRGKPNSKLESFVRALSPLGTIHLIRGTLRTDDEGIKHRDFDLKVSDGSLRYDQFPYPLYNVKGNIRVVDDLVMIDRFRASNSNGGTIGCDGEYRLPIAESGARPVSGRTQPIAGAMDLVFNAQRVALDEALRRSLPDTSQQTWDSLSPSGVVDRLDIQILRKATDAPLNLNVAGRQFESQSIGSDTLRLLPQSLPYRMDVVEGQVRYEGGQVFIDAIQAKHGDSIVNADGGCRRTPDGRWLLTVDVHNGSRLIADSELTDALPKEMRGAIHELDLRGPIGMSGLTQTILSDDQHPDPVFGWNLQLQLEGNRIGEVGPVHGLRGGLQIRGRKDHRGILAEGDVQIDSMHVNELQITSIKGPFQIRNDQLRLGSTPQNGRALEPIQGRLFDGNLRLDGNVVLSDASFDVQLALNNAKVPSLLAELGHGANDLSGTLDGAMTLEGLLGTHELLRGRGKATVKDANLYELPVLIQLLNVLSITPTEDVAFTNAFIDYTLIEDEVEFNDLRLWGSLIALRGNGTFDRRQELDLSFNTMVSPRNTFTRIFRPLADQRYTLWTVDVTGPLDDLDIQRRALERVGITLERLFPGMNTGVAAKRKDRTAGIGRMFQ